MKAFLSHSSKDKAIVENVAEILGAANVELDSLTFDKGKLNSSAILQSLRRSSLFVLFMSENSIESSAVDYEIQNAENLVASGVIERVLIICLDDRSFSQADAILKKYNIVRKTASSEAAARMIQGQLLAIRSQDASKLWPFVGRAEQLAEITEKLISPESPKTKAIFISGMPGIGRRTFARHLYEDVFPQVSRVFPSVYIDPIDGLEELFRKLIAVHTPILRSSHLHALFAGFTIADEAGKADQIVNLVASIVEGREAIFLVDRGGLLDDPGTVQAPLRLVYSRLAEMPYPGILFIAERMVPQVRRDNLPGTLYTALPALSAGETRRLVGLVLKAAGVEYSETQLQILVDLSDHHPFNVSFITEAVRERGIDLFLGGPEDLNLWKHKRGTEFLRKIAFNDVEIRILSGLVNFTGLSFDVISDLAGADDQTAASAVVRLMDLHIVELNGDLYSLSRPLRVAIERDRRFKVSKTEYKEVLLVVTKSLRVFEQGDELVPV